MHKSMKNHFKNKNTKKRLEQLKMAKYGDTKDYTYTSKKGKETKFRFNHVGLQGSFELRERADNEVTGKTSITKLHKELFENVIRTVDEAGDVQKVNYSYFEEQEDGSKMLSEVVNEAIKYTFQ